MHHVPCKDCGKPVVWGQDVTGKKIPLDVKVRVFAPRGGLPDNGVRQVMSLMRSEAMACHFDTCGRKL